MEVGRDFQKRWHATPEAIRQQVFSELNSICKLLEPVTNLAEWQAADQVRHEQQQKLVDEALEEIRLHEQARIAAEQQLAERQRIAAEEAAALAARQQAEAARQHAEALAAQQEAEARARAAAKMEAAQAQANARILAEQQASAATETAQLRQQLLDDVSIYIDLVLEQQKQQLTEWATQEIERLLASK